MRDLMTGGTGAIGSMVSQRFVQKGHRPVLMVWHLDRNLIRCIENQVDLKLADIPHWFPFPYDFSKR